VLICGSNIVGFNFLYLACNILGTICPERLPHILLFRARGLAFRYCFLSYLFVGIEDNNQVVFRDTNKVILTKLISHTYSRTLLTEPTKIDELFSGIIFFYHNFQSIALTKKVQEANATASSVSANLLSITHQYRLFDQIPDSLVISSIVEDINEYLSVLVNGYTHDPSTTLPYVAA
jgi:hypothetical protein